MRYESYFSRGKFLISGEYLVLQGAMALCVPLIPGQTMTISELPEPGKIVWETYVNTKPWLNAEYEGLNIEVSKTSDPERADFIRGLLKAGFRLQPGVSLLEKGFMIKNHIDFNIEWGLGSSASLLSNLAAWLNVDLYSFYKTTFRGSGYDVFCSRAEGPILYQLIGSEPAMEYTSISSRITDHLYFIYLGRKQDSQESVRNFLDQPVMDVHSIDDITGITTSMTKTSDLLEFMELMRRHESILSGLLGFNRVKDEFFSDFPGEIKSLGAWGGDFIMAATSLEKEKVKDYFGMKGLDIVFAWKEIVHNQLEA